MDAAARLDAYIADVQTRPETHCDTVRQAVERQGRDLARPPDGCTWSVEDGLSACDWIERHLSFTAGQFAGHPFRLQPWQVFFVALAFGWRRDGGRRRFRTLHLWVPRKAGKSELAAAIGLRMLLADDENAPLVCTTAAREQQAHIVPTAAWRMVGAMDSAVRRRYGIKRNRMTQRNPPVIEIEDGAGAFRGLPKDIGGSLDGLSPSLAVIDELHAYRAPDTYNAMAQGMGARHRALLMITSTAGDVDGVGRQQFNLACSMLAGETEKDDLFALVFAAPRSLPIDAEETWRIANPSLDVTVSLDYVRSLCAEATATGEEEAFRRKQLNQWPVRAQESADVWIAGDAWDACADGAIRPARRRAWAGLAAADGSWASALMWRDGQTWCAAIRLWESEADVRRWAVRQARRRHLVCALDPVRGQTLLRALERDGLDCVTVERTARAMWLPLTELPALVAAARLRQRSSDAVRDQMARMRPTWTADGLGRPGADAGAAALAALLATAIALAHDSENVRVDDIPDWEAI